MAIFDKKTQQEKNVKLSIKYLDSIIVDTQNAYEDLKSIASSNAVSHKVVDFKLLDVFTQYKTDEKSEEWISIETEKELYKFNNDELFLNPNLQIKQQYKVEYFDIRKNENKLILPDVILSGNKSLTKIFATIKTNLDLKFNTNFEQELLELINKKKMRSGILVGIRCSQMLSSVRKLVSLARIEGFIKEDNTFLIMEGIAPIEPIDDDLVFHYKKKVNPQEEGDRVDYSRRGYLQAVSEDELIIEYIKPKEGVAGRNCKGKYLPVKEPQITNAEQFSYTENIEKNEDEDSIKYTAKKSGYVHEEKGSYDIQEEMELSEVSFKSTGSIEAGLDTNVKINIKESDAFSDAVGPGMYIETGELNVQGNVGLNAVIKARKLNIGGQTHSSSKITADEVSVNVHLGEIEGKDVQIQRLEGGIVRADVAKIGSILGGRVEAREVYIETLVANSSVVASELVEITKVKGSGNKITIDPSQIKSIDNQAEETQAKIAELRKTLEAIPKQLEAKKSTIEKNRQSIDMIKGKIQELKKSGVKPPNSFMTKLKEFQQLINDYNELVKQMKDADFALKELQESLDLVQDKVLSAKVINKSAWKEFNEIKFKLLDPPSEYAYSTKEGEISKLITLKAVSGEEDRYYINRSNELR